MTLSAPPPVDGREISGHLLRYDVVTYLGTRVKRDARMVTADGRPAVNMFAAGEIMAGNVLARAMQPILP